MLMTTRRKLSNRGRTYVLGVIVAGTFAVVASFLEMLATPVSHEWFILAALTVVSGSATVKLPSIPASLSVSETFVFTSVLLFGPPAGTLTVAGPLLADGIGYNDGGGGAGGGVYIAVATLSGGGSISA